MATPTLRTSGAGTRMDAGVATTGETENLESLEAALSDEGIPPDSAYTEGAAFISSSGRVVPSRRSFMVDEPVGEPLSGAQRFLRVLSEIWNKVFSLLSSIFNRATSQQTETTLALPAANEEEQPIVVVNSGFELLSVLTKAVLGRFYLIEDASGKIELRISKCGLDPVEFSAKDRVLVGGPIGYRDGVLTLVADFGDVEKMRPVIEKQFGLDPNEISTRYKPAMEGRRSVPPQAPAKKETPLPAAAKAAPVSQTSYAVPVSADELFGILKKGNSIRMFTIAPTLTGKTELRVAKSTEKLYDDAVVAKGFMSYYDSDKTLRIKITEGPIEKAKTLIDPLLSGTDIKVEYFR